VSAKVFSLPNVQPGSILEYSYRLHVHDKVPDEFQHPEKYRFMRGFTYPAAQWVIQRDLFLRHGHYELHFLKGGRIRQHYLNVATGFALVELPQNTLLFNIENVQPYKEEEYAPPEDTLKSRLDLFYAEGYSSSEDFWTDVARSQADTLAA